MNLLRKMIGVATAASLALTPGLTWSLQPGTPNPNGPQAGFIGKDPAPAGTVSWQLLQQAKTIQKPDKKFGPQFTSQIKELDQQSVKLYGFMMPLDQSEKQKRFLLAAFPPHCTFCMPGGPESLVEVLASEPVKFSFEPMVLAGKLHVLENDIVYYRLTDAKSVKF